MYETLLTLHSYLRWLALVGVVLAFLVGLRGWLSGAAWTTTARKISLLFIIGFDLQFLLGAFLYFQSPIVKAALSNMKLAMKDAQLRFWAVEHGPMMVLAVVLAHVGNVLVKKSADDKSKYKRLAIFAGLVLLLVLVMMPWPGRVAGRPLFR